MKMKKKFQPKIQRSQQLDYTQKTKNSFKLFWIFRIKNKTSNDNSHIEIKFRLMLK